MSLSTAFQDQIPHNHCFGCGPGNQNGLRIKSYWSGDHRSVCHFTPCSFHSAGPEEYLNGGIIATVIDCHCICTAVADAYRREGREIGSHDLIWYVTGQLNIRYLKPAAIDSEVILTATLDSVSDRKTVLKCELESLNEIAATAELVAIRVPESWFSGT